MGGAEKLIAEGARYWDRRRYLYHVAYVLPWKNQLVPDLERLEFPVHMLGGERGSMFGFASRFRSLALAIGASLVHTHSPLLGVAARLTTRIPVVHTEHNLAHSYHPLTRVTNRLTYARNEAVIAVSDAVAGSLSSYPGPTPPVIPNGVAVSVSPEAAAAARSELGISSETPLVVHVGNIRPGKAHRNLIDAAALLGSDSAARFVSIGGEKHPGDLARVRAEAQAASAPITFLGRRPDAAAFIAAADVLVNPSDVEGLPVVVLEAMALGTPVVATSVGGVPGVIDHGTTGLLVPPRDPAALAEAVSRLLADPALAGELARQARKKAEAEHGLEAMVSKVEAVYRRVLDG